MWHKFKKDLFSYYSMQKVNGVMGVNGIMRTCHMCFLVLKVTVALIFNLKAMYSSGLFTLLV